PWIWPFLTLKDTPLSAVIPPNFLSMLWIDKQSLAGRWANVGLWEFKEAFFGWVVEGFDWLVFKLGENRHPNSCRVMIPSGHKIRNATRIAPLINNRQSAA